MTGWKESTLGIKSLADLPFEARKYVKKIEDLCGVTASIISTGAKREETISFLE